MSRLVFSVLLSCVGFSSVPDVAEAANWHAFGVCSYHVDLEGNERFELISRSACKQDFYGGTGFWVSTFEWENGNSVQVVFNIDEFGREVTSVNNRVSLLTTSLASGQAEDQQYGACYILKAEQGFEAVCYKRIGEQFFGH